MAQLGRLEIEVQDSTGLANNGASVEVRLQGATVNGNQTISSGSTLTVRSPGGIIATDGLAIYDRATNSGIGTTKRATSGSVNSFTAGTITATTIQVSWGGGGTLTVTDGDRITLTSPVASSITLYKNADTTDAYSSSTLTTASNGIAFAYALAGFYDVLVSGGTANATATLFTDRRVQGNSLVATDILGANQHNFLFNTNRSQSTGNLLTVQNLGTNKLRVTSAAGVLIADGLTVATGGITVSAGASTFAAAVTVNATLTGSALVSSGSLTVASGATITSGGLTVTAGGLTVSASGITVTGNSTITGTLTSLTGITSSGTASFATAKHSAAFYISGRETIASGTTISVAATTAIVETTGTTNIATINLAGGAPGASDDGRVLFIVNSDTGAQQLVTGGNIVANSTSLAQSDATIICWNNSLGKWEYIGRN